MKICPNCRSDLKENTKFCIECGSRIDFQTTRNGLDEAGDTIVEASEGLRIDRNSDIKNPFYANNAGLRDKILNPVLTPLPPKRKVFFREQLFSSGNDESEDVMEKMTSEAVEEIKSKEYEWKIKQAPVDEATEKAEKEITEELEEEIEPKAVRDEMPEDSRVEIEQAEVEAETEEKPEGKIAPEQDEHVKYLSREEATDFEALKVLFESDETEEVMQETLPEEEVSEERPCTISEPFEKPEKENESEAVQEEMSEDPEEETEESEEIIEQIVVEEEVESVEVEEEIAEEPEEEIEQSTIEEEIEPEESEEKTEPEETDERPKAETLSTDDIKTEFLLDEIGTKLSEQLEKEIDENHSADMEKASETKPNRIITKPVGGGFRR